jgi:cation diffusion facilitator family transporter
MKNEKRALKLSAWAYLGMALLGIGFATLTRSDAILLSGFFSLIAFVMGLLTLKVSDLVQQPTDERFHFGYAFFEPLLNSIKGLFILAVCGISLASAADAMLHGGVALSAEWALLYAGIALVGCFAIALVVRRWARKTGSPLLEVDAKNWMLDGFVNTGVGVAFLIALLLADTRWSSLVPYVDPVLLTVLVLALVWIPLRTVKENVQQLLQVAPPAPLQRDVRDRFESSVKGLSLENTHVRMAKIGRYFYVMIQLVVPSSFRLSRVGELDEVRRRVAGELKGIHPRLVIDMIFTEDEALVE